MRYRHFDEVIRQDDRNFVATIIQELDTAGRTVREYGWDHPRLGLQYLVELRYYDTLRVITFYRWNAVDSSALRMPSIKNFVQQRQIIESRLEWKERRLLNESGDSLVFKGQLIDISKDNRGSSDQQEEERRIPIQLPWSAIAIDSLGRFVVQ